MLGHNIFKALMYEHHMIVMLNVAIIKFRKPGMEYDWSQFIWRTLLKAQVRTSGISQVKQSDVIGLLYSQHIYSAIKALGIHKG